MIVHLAHLIKCMSIFCQNDMKENLKKNHTGGKSKEKNLSIMNIGQQ